MLVWLLLALLWRVCRHYSLCICLITLLIGDAGAASLSAALASMSSLQSLELSSNEIGDAGAASLSAALASMSSLQSLNLSWNEIGDEHDSCDCPAPQVRFSIGSEHAGDCKLTLRAVGALSYTVLVRGMR